MIIELSQYLNGNKDLRGTVIVGSGIAALATAFALEKQGVECVLLESGSTPGDQEWDIGSEPIAKADYGVPDSYTKLHVRREPGGGSSVWGGWCTSLREINFSRPDMPAYPSWPITREQLLPYYSRAAEWLQIKGGKRAELSEILIPTSQDLAAKPFGFSPPARYTSHYREHALKSKKIILITGATVHSLAANAGRVTSINVGDKQKKISLKCSGPVVLAGGAIGNSRILARSKASLDLPAKIHKYVGNFFFEHPHCYSLGHVLFKPEIAETISKPEFMSGSFISITPTSSYLTHNNLLDFNFQLSKDDQSSLKARNMPIIRNYKALYGIEPQLYRATLGMEQLPLESNSVINKSTVNGLNDGHLTLDLTTQKPLVAAAKKWLYLQGVHAWIESQPESQIQAVGHLHGTTRMSQNSDSGVVDANCRVYGLNNLFVAGSSVFPTAGFSNPTFTITALAIRLADHIATT